MRSGGPTQLRGNNSTVLSVPTLLLLPFTRARERESVESMRPMSMTKLAGNCDEQMLNATEACFRDRRSGEETWIKLESPEALAKAGLLIYQLESLWIGGKGAQQSVNHAFVDKTRRWDLLFLGRKMASVTKCIRLS